MRRCDDARRFAWASAFAAGLFAGFAASAASAEWQQLGPSGGEIRAVASLGKRVYALVGVPEVRVFRSDDDGATWREMPSPGCLVWNSPWPIRIRDSGHVYIDCSPVMRSVDGGLTWARYGPQQTSGNLAFHPLIPSRAAISGAEYYTSFVHVTIDDGATWERQFAQPGEVKPNLIAYDPIRDDRMVGVGVRVQNTPGPSGTVQVYSLESFDSFDNGYSFTPTANLVPSTTSDPCYARALAVERSGRHYVNTDCGLFRSPDGRTWMSTTGFPLDGQATLKVDPNVAGRLLALGYGGLFETVNAGVDWHLIDLPPDPVNDLWIASDGKTWIATDEAVHVKVTASSAWDRRVAGLNARPFRSVEPTEGGAVLIALGGTSGRQLPNAQSFDGGRSWTTFAPLGESVGAVSRNPANAMSLLSLTGALQPLHSLDGGRTWQRYAADAALPTGTRITGVVPVGPQPGVVWALHTTCVASGFLGCFHTPQGVARSEDGGQRWTTIAKLEASPTASVVPSGVDTRVAMTSMANAVYLTRDAGATWIKVLDVISARLIADPADPARWHAYGPSAGLLYTADYGANWSYLTYPPMASFEFDIVVDPRQAERLIAVGASAEVSVSPDRGASWIRVVDPSLTIEIAKLSTRVGPEVSTTIYAAGAQGVLKLPLPSVAEVVRAVEYWNADLGHYFLTADTAEIGLLDGQHFKGWVRTGESFEVYSPATMPPTEASPVCRYYGLPESGLNTHFYSASPIECQAVRERFGDAWTLETSDAFAVHVPDSSTGQCPDGRTPVYRVFNGRADINHRYVTSQSLRAAMIASGWIPEGFGSLGVAMCSP